MEKRFRSRWMPEGSQTPTSYLICGLMVEGLWGFSSGFFTIMAGKSIVSSFQSPDLLTANSDLSLIIPPLAALMIYNIGKAVSECHLLAGELHQRFHRQAVFFN